MNTDEYIFFKLVWVFFKIYLYLFPAAIFTVQMCTELIWSNVFNVSTPNFIVPDLFFQESHFFIRHSFPFYDLFLQNFILKMQWEEFCAIFEVEI